MNNTKNIYFMKRLFLSFAVLALAGATALAQDIETTYAKSDFVPGDEIFFEDDLANEKVGEFPSQWDLLDGIAEVAVIDGRKVIYFPDEGYGKVNPLMKQKDYLPDVFTLELDLYIDQWSDPEDYKQHEYNIVFSSSAADEIRFEGETGHFTLGYNTQGEGWCAWGFNKPDLENWTEGDKYMGFNPDYGRYNAKDNPLKIGWNHLAFSFNKRAMKVYINGIRIVNIPNAAAPTRFCIWHGEIFEKQGVTGIRLAKGAVPLYDRLTSDGKIISYGITFATGKAELKPESMTEIARIAKLMAEHPELNFEVQGHCDNTGSDKVNDPLSQKRAEAVVDALVKQGVAADRLSAVGKGSHVPIADNNSDEGRAKNRRVEFVKKSITAV